MRIYIHNLLKLLLVGCRIWSTSRIYQKWLERVGVVKVLLEDDADLDNSSKNTIGQFIKIIIIVIMKNKKLKFIFYKRKFDLKFSFKVAILRKDK